MNRVTPTIAEIDRKALRFNFRQLKRCLPANVQSLCVVKSNAYGHGAPEVARTLQKAGADFFGVGTVDEGIQLRQAGIKGPILILLGILNDHFESLLRYRLTPVLYDLKSGRELDSFLRKKRKKLGVHLKVDTGMTRLGVLPSKFLGFCEEFKKFGSLIPQGLLTHFAEAGDEKFTKHQINLFHQSRLILEKTFSSGGKVIHLANSQASIDRRFDRSAPQLARFGIALYGSFPLERDRKQISLKPVLTWKTRIVSLKEVPPGTPVSYNRTFKTRRKSRIAVLPIGYADGYPRILSNQARVLVCGKSVPIVGMVCMDMTMIDVTSVPSAKVGDEVILIGKQGKLQIEAEELAKMAKTISYEIFCGISERVPRVYR